MKTHRNILSVTLVAAALVASGAFAQVSSSATAGASVNIMKAIHIDTTADLDFGTLVQGTGGGTITVGNGVVVKGDVQSINGVGAKGATFEVSGETGASYSIFLPTSIDLSNNLSVIKVDDFFSIPSKSSVIPFGGVEHLTVGATLHLEGKEASGYYEGGFDVLVAYN